ncbi:ABSCISIC ACID-INSENSITIVE 5-like protein 5 [Glycine soja]|uniref:ABSCISIC ACID-INSENSITIVE 5-like protein 5 n=1 Tax=Glycine soja TaxID=3848 RepID=UPI0003DE98FF|nr:ABSCISIC ACID-INSENSITIVE 5-like protein 5 [Glycine soja]|eukprot:XP_006588064.1 ABSCISIC ACID-INSENSITIVE 5-like protein 5 [Glycine max]
MDEFLSSIWNSDDNNQVNPPLPTLDEAAKGKSVVATKSTTISQPLSIPPPICKKIMDEIWSQIHKSQPHYNEANNSLVRNEPLLKRQQTLGEMTLEDFLVKAGVVQESSSLFKSSLLYQNQIGNIAKTMQIARRNGDFVVDATTGTGVAIFNGVLHQAWTRQFDWRVEGRGLQFSGYVQQLCRRRDSFLVENASATGDLCCR